MKKKLKLKLKPRSISADNIRAELNRGPITSRLLSKKYRLDPAIISIALGLFIKHNPVQTEWRQYKDGRHHPAQELWYSWRKDAEA